MNKIKELTDFYMWMQENDYEHNIRARVEKKAKQYLNDVNARQNEQFCECDGVQDLIAGTGQCRKCGKECTY